MKVALYLLLVFWFVASSVSAAAPAPDLLQAKKDAESRGYIFETSHDEIVAQAKKEGKLRALSGMERDSIHPMREAFRKRYPFIDVFVEEITGTDSNQRFLLEIKTGRVKGWDSTHLSVDLYNEYAPYLKKFDILGMARQGVLNVPTQIVDPARRDILAIRSNIQLVAYNKQLISADKVPDTCEGFLQSDFKGRKFLADIRPTEISALVPAWGLEKTLDFARKLALQEPIWVRGNTRPLASMLTGEYSLFIGPNFTSVIRAIRKDPTGNLHYKIVEPVPTRFSDANAVLIGADHPYGGLLWLEFLVSPEGQKMVDEYEPYGASVFTAGSVQEKLTRGKRLSLVNWDHFTKMQDYQAKVVEAYGFPKAAIK